MVCLLPLCKLACFSIQQITIPQTTSNPHKTQLFHNFSTPFELQQLHALLIKTRTPLSALPPSRVASVCALTPHFPYARQILQQADDPEIFIWNRCLTDFVDSASPFDAILLFRQLLEHSVFPDCFTYSFVLNACVKLADLNHGRIIHAFVEKLGLQFNLVLQNAIVNLYASGGEMDHALLLFDKMPQRDSVTWNTMITQLVRRGDADSAFKMFDQMPEKNLRSWTAMIAGFVQCGMPKQALRLFSEMEEAGLRPNEVTVVAVLAACADLGALDLGSRIHEYSIRSGFNKNARVCNTLIDMYIKCGSLQSAYDVFEGMEERTVVSWSAMVQGFAIHGKAEEALQLFFRMIQSGMQPNGVTFIGLLNACSHMGLVNEGKAFFSSMTRDYGIIPQIEHYGCMVDLLSRAGLLQEAHAFINQMTMKPNAAVWGALLGGCKAHKNVEMAETAMASLQELDPLNDGYYVVLANVYSEARKWDDAAKVRKLMRSKGVKKTIGWSSISVKGAVHEFVAGDESHPRSGEIYKEWEQLQVQMRVRGYEADTSVVLLDVDEAEKAKVVSRHSEKLALAFGLIESEAGETIRIYKNLRICEDCHASFKLISEIVGRRIVVRDRNRFHYFKDGYCSCRDYW